MAWSKTLQAEYQKVSASLTSSTACYDADFGVNIITNSSLYDDTNGWFPLGNCTMSVQTGSPLMMPQMARDSLGAHEPLSGHYILVTNRTQNWMGPGQMITDKVKLYLTYQVSAWVKIEQASGLQRVNVAVGVDNQWVNGGQVEISNDRWHEIGVSFRIEKQAAKVMIYIQGPAAGVDLMVAGLQFFPVDRRARFRQLKRQIAKIHKRDVILKFSGSYSSNLHGTFVRIRQQQNNFPFGSAIRRTNMDNGDLNDFFVKNFNWAVFGNELKCYWTEAQQGDFNYKDTDKLLYFCKQNMFKTAHQLDPSALLFVNDYHVEDGSDFRSSPEKYIVYIRHLQEDDSPVGGIGIQGHIDSPVGPIVCSALDKLDILGLPIWFTEVYVSSDNEYVKADDLEVILREAYAHPAVEGITLCRFWELFMSRSYAHLVNAKGDLNETGKGTLLLSTSGYPMLMVILMNKANSALVDSMALMRLEVITKKFIVDKGNDTLVISVDI